MKVSEKSESGWAKSLFSGNTCIDGFIGVGTEYAMLVYVSVCFLLCSGFSAAFFLLIC